MRIGWVSMVLVACTGTTIGETDSDPSDGTDATDVVVLNDVDGDGYTDDVDCNDLDPRVSPGASEVAWNGVDDDCDGRIDGDGGYEGTAQVVFRATVEGRNYRWDLECPTAVSRSGWTVDLEITCQPPTGDELARQVMGETLWIREQDNIAEEGRLDGSIVVESSDGWSVVGGGAMIWSGLDSVTGQASMTSRFARANADFSATFVD